MFPWTGTQGPVINGKLIINHKEDLTLKALTLNFKGMIKCSWSESMFTKSYNAWLLGVAPPPPLVTHLTCLIMIFRTRKLGCVLLGKEAIDREAMGVPRKKRQLKGSCTSRQRDLLVRLSIGVAGQSA